MSGNSQSSGYSEIVLANLKYSLVIETIPDPDMVSFYSPDLEGFTGTATSVEDCVAKANSEIEEHLAVMRDEGLSVPPPNPQAKIILSHSNLILLVA